MVLQKYLFFTEKSLFENLKPRVTSFCRLEKVYDYDTKSLTKDI